MMAAPSAMPYADGSLKGVLYAFAAVGDTLPMHDHDACTMHISVVTSGAFTVRDPGWSKLVAPGPVLSFSPGNPHEFVAMQPNSRVLNILKG